MNFVVKSALAGAVLIVAHACATPVEIADDVLPVDPNVFGDAGLPPASAGAASMTARAGADGTGIGVGASGGTTSTGTGVGGTSAGSGMQAAAGSNGIAPVGPGGSGTSVGGAAALGGTGGASAGAAGTPAAAGAGGSAGSVGSAGSGAQAAFDPGACNFDDVTGCEDLTCLAGCAPNDGGGSCSTRCETLITCVTTDPDCTITEADPLCAARVNGVATACTQEADAAGGANTTQTTQPSFVARQFVECICSARL
jgi:hypothetical protein